jgi:hypothetical protein
MSAAVAHADPSFVVAESQARAGDVVHFTISGADGKLTYDIEVDDRDVLKGSGKGVIGGQFTMPDLGSKAKSVTVEAEMRDEDGDEEDKRKLQYLGQALPVEPPAPEPQAAPPAAPQPAPAAAPSAPVAAAPAAPAKSVGKPSKGKRRHVRKRRHKSRERSRSTSKAKSKPRAHTQTRTRREAGPVPRKTTSKRRPAPRRAPLFNGVPEPDTGGFSAARGTAAKEGRPKPPTALVTNPVANRDNPGEPATAILIPGVLGLIGFILAGATVLRQRRNH